MKRLFGFMWRRLFLSNFLSGLLLLLPIALTGLLMAWAGGKVVAAVGPGTTIGIFLQDVGLRFAANPSVAAAIGWLLVLACVWFIGLGVKLGAKSGAKSLIDDAMSGLDRIPAFGTVHKSVKQVVGMFGGDGSSQLKAMKVVMCRLGEGAGVLSLLTSPQVYEFGGKKYNLIFMPSVPMPMTGGMLFVSVDAVEIVDMAVDDMVRVCISLGMLAPQAIPEAHLAGDGSS